MLHVRLTALVALLLFGGTAAQACDLWVDPNGLVHLRAPDELSGLECVGKVHGTDRAWQMDYLRRTAQGRKAEIFGWAQFKSDFFLRTLGFSERAEILWPKLDPPTRARMEAYARGVNEGFEASGRLAYEFQELGYSPEPWRPQDTLLLLYLQGFGQTRRSFERNLSEENWSNLFGALAPELFAPEGVPWFTPIMKPDESPAATPVPGTKRHAQADSAPHFTTELPLGDSPEWGSNSWALSPSRSRTGRAWFANDPHLGLRTPAFWHWIHLETPEYDVIGAMLPGIPAVVSGVNRHVAWGLTNSFFDVMRAHLIARSELETRGIETTRPLIWFKWHGIKIPFFFKTIERVRDARLSPGWPILPLTAPKGDNLVLTWTGFELAPNQVPALFDLAKSGSAAEIDATFMRVGLPSWNFAYADTGGHIGFRVVGRLTAVPPGGPAWGTPLESVSALDVRAPLAPERAPHLMDPKRGFIATANNAPWAKDASDSAGRAQIESFREYRIEELLKAQPKHTLESLAKVQCDTQAVDARFFVPLLLKTVSPQKDEKGSHALALLKEWDFETGPECRACGIYRRWMDHLLNDNSLKEPALYRLLSDPRLAAQVYPKGGIAKPVNDAFGEAAADLMLHDPVDWPKWGDIHVAPFPHLSEDPRFAPEGAIPTRGDKHSVNPGTPFWEGDHYEHLDGASQRLIVEMTDPPTVHLTPAGVDPDRERPQIAADNSAWRKWADCRLTRQAFPLDWNGLPVTPIEPAGEPSPSP